MRTTNRQSAVGAACTALALGSACPLSSGQSFTGLGNLPGGSDSNGLVIADGSVVGYCGTSSGHQAFRWTLEGGLVALGTLPGDMYSFGYGASADGSVVAGYSGAISLPSHAFRWTSAGGMENLGVLPGAAQSFARGMSRDGLVIVGDCKDAPPQGGQLGAFKWTAAAGMEGLPALPGGNAAAAQSASANGAFIVGYSSSSGGDHAVRWTGGGGAVEDLGVVGADSRSYAYGCSPDGAVVVGLSGDSLNYRAFRWTSPGGGGGGMVSLGTLSGLPRAAAFGVSADGSVVVGSCNGDTASAVRAFMWTASLGMVDLNTYLPTLGIDLTGWTLSSANDVSPDGQTLVGNGRHNNVAEGWILHLSSCGPADYDHNGRVEPADISLFVQTWFASLNNGTLAGDFDGNGVVEPADISRFVAVWFGALSGGC